MSNNWYHGKLYRCRTKQTQTRERETRGTHLPLELLSHPRESCPRDARGDRRDARLVPPNTRVDDARASVFNVLGQRHDLLPAKCVRQGNGVEAGYTENTGVATVEAV